MQLLFYGTKETLQIKKPLIISIAAGINLHSIDSWSGSNLAIVRCMPNTPALVGQGASGLFTIQLVSQQQKHISENILNAVGISVWVESEDELDAVTAVSGSGPAYYFLFMEAMIEAGHEFGIGGK